VLWSEQSIRGGTARAVAINSGGANCYTGAEGFTTTHRTAQAVADALGVGAVDVQVCSTGLIGQLNDRERLLDGVRCALDSLSREGAHDAAEAILTTDSHPKQVVVERDGYTVGAMAKGAGMLAPALATMLVFITTDAQVTAADCDVA